MKEKDEESDPPVGWIGGAIAIGAVLLLIAYAAVLLCANLTWTERAQFGDMFGGANALFSGLALAGVVVAIWLQRKELALQRLELKETRRELARTAEAQAKSADIVERQFNLARATAHAADLESYTRTAPILKLRGLSRLNTGFALHLTNEGSTITYVTFDTVEIDVNLRPRSFATILEGEQFSLEFIFAGEPRPLYSCEIEFTDCMSRERSRTFLVDPKRPTLTENADNPPVWPRNGEPEEKQVGETG